MKNVSNQTPNEKLPVVEPVPPVVASALIAVIVFFVCLWLLPILGFILGGFLPSPLQNLCWPLFLLPMEMIWFGELFVGEGAAKRSVSNVAGYHYIPYFVWLVLWPAFSWATCQLKGRQIALIAFGMIVVVTFAMYLMRTAAGIRLVVDLM